MASTETSSPESTKFFRSCARALTSALSEWLLIFMLFIDATFSYLFTKFSRYRGLQTPCLLCSRLDHVLGNERLKFYWDLICRNHKLEISSLVYCHAHDNLVDVHGLCETCLFSFATIGKSNAETYRLLVGKLGEDSRFRFDEDPLLQSHNSSILSTTRCSCCNQQFVLKGHDRNLIPATYPMDDKQSESVEFDKKNMKLHHPLSHVGYRTVKVNSDTESEVENSDDGEAGSRILERDYVKDDYMAQRSLPKSKSVTLSDDSATEKLIDPGFGRKTPSVSILDRESDGVNSCGGTSLGTSVEIGHGLEELNWQELSCRTHSKLISIHDDVPILSNAEETPVDVLKESNVVSLALLPKESEMQESAVREIPIEVLNDSNIIPLVTSPSLDFTEDCRLNFDTSTLLDISETSLQASKTSKIIPIDDVPSPTVHETLTEVSEDVTVVVPSDDDVVQSSSPAEIPLESSKESCATKSVEVGELAVLESEEGFPTTTGATTSERACETDVPISDLRAQVPNSLDLSDAYKLAIGSKGKQQSPMLAELLTGKDVSKLGEDLKALLSQLSAARSMERSLSDFSPKMAASIDELKTSDPSTSNGMQLLHKMISLERNESNISLDGSLISEIEGENELDRFKRQIEHDRRLLSALYRELEEERNASAVAVNQSMAMITRLQEEKATFQMEALQNLRMMEEQAEYDMEALQNSNDLLAEKEKEIQDLEYELEFYRSKSRNDSMFADNSESNHVEAQLVDQENSVIEEHNICNKVEEMDKPFRWDSKNLSTGFEEERLYILQWLEKLEKKLCLVPDNGIHSDLTNGECNQDEKSDQKNITDDDDLPAHTSSFEDSRVQVTENIGISSSRQSSNLEEKDVGIAYLGAEVSDLNERLKELKSDQSFLEQTIKSLGNGDEGLQFVREIASHLRELRNIGIRRRSPPEI